MFMCLMRVNSNQIISALAYFLYLCFSFYLSLSSLAPTHSSQTALSALMSVKHSPTGSRCSPLPSHSSSPAMATNTASSSRHPMSQVCTSSILLAFLILLSSAQMMSRLVLGPQCPSSAGMPSGCTFTIQSQAWSSFSRYSFLQGMKKVGSLTFSFRSMNLRLMWMRLSLGVELMSWYCFSSLTLAMMPSSCTRFWMGVGLCYSTSTRVKAQTELWLSVPSLPTARTPIIILLQGVVSLMVLVVELVQQILAVLPEIVGIPDLNALDFGPAVTCHSMLLQQCLHLLVDQGHEVPAGQVQVDHPGQHLNLQVGAGPQQLPHPLVTLRPQVLLDVGPGLR